jgi:hypothetical protein
VRTSFARSVGHLHIRANAPALAWLLCINKILINLRFAPLSSTTVNILKPPSTARHNSGFLQPHDILHHAVSIITTYIFFMLVLAVAANKGDPRAGKCGLADWFSPEFPDVPFDERARDLSNTFNCDLVGHSLHHLDAMVTYSPKFPSLPRQGPHVQGLRMHFLQVRRSWLTQGKMAN